MNELISRRGQLKGQLTRLATYLRDNTNYVDQIDVDQIRLRAEKARETWDDFQEVQAQIEAIEITAETESYRVDFEDLFYKNLALCDRLVKEYSSVSSNVSAELHNGEAGGTPVISASQSGSGPQSVHSAIKLAALQIPTFSGIYTEWATFYDIFVALVHNNASLSDVQKFFYLRSALTGDAGHVIQCLQTTSDNYRVAWESLVTRYNNKRVLVQVHVQALFDLESLKKESSLQLRKLVDTLIGNLKALESLGQKPENWGALLLHLITSKLDSSTMREWETIASKTEVPTIDSLIDFLQSRFRILEAVESSKQINISRDNIYKPGSVMKKQYNKSNTFAATGEIKCFVCKKAHTIYHCPSFLGLSITDRIKRVAELKLCKTCLRSHIGEKCRARRCPTCARPHNGLLHIPRPDKQDDTGKTTDTSTDATEQNKSDTEEKPPTSITINAHTYRKNECSQVLLSTATVIAYDCQRKPVLCRVLLDSGSQHNFITESMAQHLKLKRSKTSCSVIGINGASHTSSGKITTTIKSRNSDYSLSLCFYVLPRLTAKLPLMPVDLTSFRIPTEIALADPNFNIPKPIDMLIGAEIFFDLLSGDQIRPVTNGPILNNTLFGWIVSGPVPQPPEANEHSSISLFTCVSNEFENLENQMAAFWRLEEIKQTNVYTLEERICKQYFERSVCRGDDGRFTVLLPFRDASKLGNSYESALRRFLALERRLQLDSNLKKDYTKFMNEYIALGHMELTRRITSENNCYYLPHHAVRKESSSSTKLRVVFDASSKTDSSVSLNDVLLKGPCIQEELVSILSRFRTHKYVITADIKKMYRQIWVNENQRDYQRILWREDPRQPLNVFKLKTVTYGVITASYLATACLKKLSEEEAPNYPEACLALSRDFYVDDFLGGAASKNAALKLRDDLINVLAKAGMELCKWSSNQPDLLSTVNTASKSTSEHSWGSEEKIIKILGLYWNHENDSFQYKVMSFNKQTRVTKRIILSEIASIFDPLGLISPVVINFKIMIQKLWQLKLDWDATLPSSFEAEWQHYRGKLTHLNSLVVERNIIGDGDICDVQLHGFADASLTSYGACLYLRVKNSVGNITTNLICAKSRVAPLKTISLPRLELLAAVLLARLISKYSPSLNLPIKETHCWSDSTVVLSWISSQSSRWKTFVAHRIGEIHELTSISQWRHVGSKDNPADIVSRGCCPTQINNLKLWWRGPSWLSLNYTEWPQKGKLYQDEKEIPEARTISHVSSHSDYDLSILEKYSSLDKLARVLSYCRRFVNNASGKRKILGPISAHEMNETITIIVKLVQKSSFNDEITDLKGARQLQPRSPLLRLRPFLDENGVLRVGGRLANSSVIDICQRHPIIVPSKSTFTYLIFLKEHKALMHAGPQAILSSIRLKYWPLNGRNIARQVVQRCVQCFKYRPVVTQPIMGDLPKSRVEPARAFVRTGVDFAGPFYIKASLRRNAPINKAYACVFVCFTTKAVHMELVSDLTTRAFLNALQRFFDRRGLCTDIYSDNATNFVGARRELQELKNLFMTSEHQEQVQTTLSQSGIQWHFIPPRSPHFGGLWEAAIKSLKSHLYRTLGNASLTFEELNTVLVRIEAILNSRPITPLSTDPSDLSVLTPGHFLIGDSLTALPERDETLTPQNRLTRWRRVVQISQHFWSRWSKDYLNQLQERGKWLNSKGPNLHVGTIVLIRDENLPPLKWSIGRVIEVHSGSDKQVRVATVKTARGEFKRAVRTLCPLPFEGN